MKNRLVFLSALFLSVLLLGLVSSANTVTLTKPAQDGVVNGSYYLNASMDTNTLLSQNASFFYDTGTSNVSICKVRNNTATAFNCSWDTTAITDRNNIVVWVNISNGTADISMDSSTGVDIDQGNPTATISSSSFSDNTALISSTLFTFGIDADSSIGISSCMLWFENINNGAITNKSVTVSGNACTNTTTSSAESLGVNEAYYVKIQATDGNGDTTNTTARTLRVTPASGGGGGGGSSPAVKQSILGDDLNGVPKTSGIGISIKNFIDSIVNFFKGLFD